MRVKRSLIFLMALAASSLLLLVVSSKAETRPVLRANKPGIGSDRTETTDRNFYLRWELLTGLLVRPAV